MKEMAGYEKFYTGADYGLEKKYDDDFLQMEYRTPTGNIGLTTDARTANQLQSATQQFNTGAKAIEVQMTMPEVAESIPEQHLVELNRLKKLMGADFTVHGPLVEPTGVTRRGWDPTQRQQAERQMWLGLSRAHKVDPDGNVVVTFHSSNGLPDPETVVYDDDTQQPKVTNIMLIDERTGDFGQVMPKKHNFPGQESDPRKEIENQNKEAWFRELQHVSFNANQGEDVVKHAFSGKEKEIEDLKKLNGRDILGKTYKLYTEGKKEEALKNIGNIAVTGPIIDDLMSQITRGDIYLRDAYEGFKNLYEKSYDAAERSGSEEDIKKLKAFANEIAPKVKYLENDPSRVDELGQTIVRGVEVLRSISPPQTLRPLKEFAIEQASETFSNLAVKSYNEFKDKAPVISIENPPAGSGLSRAEDIKELIEKSREKFVEKATKEGMSKYEAKQQSEKLIGATWDLGHINMIKKFGFDDKTLVEETKKIAPYVKNVHLSDNFGMEHTELPMGMGNVPTKKHMDILNQYNEKVKKIIETGQWYQHFKTSPFGETLSAFGSPIYSMQLSPSWNQEYVRNSGGYFAGYGTNPDVHHSVYGAGFSGLPLELGGQIAGRSRFSGTAME
ncbi:MAG: hypothetical protein AABX85_03520 [Nanoarchaeota archaeon]